MFNTAIEIPSAAAVAFEAELARFEDLAEDMAAYAAGELEEFDGPDDFNDPFENACPPTEEEQEQGREAEEAHRRHLDAMQELDAYCQAQAEAAAQEGDCLCCGEWSDELQARDEETAVCPACAVRVAAVEEELAS